MVKTILIHVDFRVESLNTLKLALAQSNENNVGVVLMCAEILSDSISDLLFYSQEKIINARMKPEFLKAIAIIKNRFENKIKRFEIEVFHGRNQSSLERFMKANKIDEIYIPKTYVLKLSGPAFDPLPLLKKYQLPVYQIDWDQKQETSEEDQLNALFN